MPTRLIVWLGFFVVATCNCIAPTFAEAQKFVRPKQGIHLLDWCFQWGTGCGERAANAWCVSKGFAKALTFAEWTDAGKPTKLIGSGEVCDQYSCDAFRFIVCATVGSRTFQNPRHGAQRLDWCYSWGDGCGAAAANAWCRTKGFKRGASSFTMAANIGAVEPTRLITGPVCSEAFCDGFSSITCEP